MPNRLTMVILLTGTIVCGNSNATDEDQTDVSKPQTVLSPQDIIDNGPKLMDREKVVVRFEVGSIMKVPTIYPDGSKRQVLHLVPNDVDAKFTAPISPKFLNKLNRIGIDDVSKHFVGRTVTLQGFVSGTATELIGSPTFWTYHITLNSYENVQSVADNNHAAGQQADHAAVSSNAARAADSDTGSAYDG